MVLLAAPTTECGDIWRTKYQRIQTGDQLNIIYK